MFQIPQSWAELPDAGVAGSVLDMGVLEHLRQADSTSVAETKAWDDWSAGGPLRWRHHSPQAATSVPVGAMSRKS